MALLLFLLVWNRERKCDPSDEELWESFLSGDKEAISELFLRHHGDLYRYGLKINSSGEAVRDGIQELFLRLWKRPYALEQAVSVKKYLIISLRRILLRQLEQYDSREKRNYEYAVDAHQKVAAADEIIIRAEMHREQQKSLDESLLTLSDRQREVLFLKFYEGYNNKEISEIMGITYQRVSNIAHETIHKLRETLK